MQDVRADGGQGTLHATTLRARRTVATSLARGGRGVHSGAACHAAIGPAPPGHGIRINGTPATLAAVTSAPGATILQTRAGPVRTVEHLLAALALAGIDDAAIVVAGGEVPILDGSAAGWPIEARAHGGTVVPIRLEAAVHLEADGGWIAAEPAEGLSFEVSVAFPIIGEQRLFISDFEELCQARTFGFAADVPRLHALGLARGADLTNTVALDGPPLPWRFADEPVRHKALDLLGDLALLGRPLRARVRVHRGTHRLHHRLVAAILDQTRPA